MTNRFMMSVAAVALLAGTSFANAQGAGHEGAAPAEHAAPAQHAAPAAPAGKPAMASPGMKAESAPKAAETNGGQRAQNTMQPNEKGAPAHENMSSENNNNNRMGEKAEGRENNTAEGRDNNVNRETNTSAESKGAQENRQENHSQTVGQAAAGAKITTEQRTKITSVIREQHVQPLDHVNFSISVGTRVPRDISFHALPPEIITYYPEWRGYEYVLVNGQILVIDPNSYEIVAVLDV